MNDSQAMALLRKHKIRLSHDGDGWLAESLDALCRGRTRMSHAESRHRDVAQAIAGCVKKLHADIKKWS